MNREVAGIENKHTCKHMIQTKWSSLVAKYVSLLRKLTELKMCATILLVDIYVDVLYISRVVSLR